MWIKKIYNKLEHYGIGEKLSLLLFRSYLTEKNTVWVFEDLFQLVKNTGVEMP